MNFLFSRTDPKKLGLSSQATSGRIGYLWGLVGMDDPQGTGLVYQVYLESPPSCLLPRRMQ